MLIDVMTSLQSDMKMKLMLLTDIRLRDDMKTKNCCNLIFLLLHFIRMAAHWYKASCWGIPLNRLLFACHHARTVRSLNKIWKFIFFTLVCLAGVINTCLPGVYFWLYTRLFFITCREDGWERERGKPILRKLERMKTSSNKPSLSLGLRIVVLL